MLLREIQLMFWTVDSEREFLSRICGKFVGKRYPQFVVMFFSEFSADLTMPSLYFAEEALIFNPSNLQKPRHQPDRVL